jgi:hypothetical protein
MSLGERIAVVERLGQAFAENDEVLADLHRRP